MPRFIPVLVLALAIVGTPVRTASRTDSWRWQMAPVDATREHLELRYGSIDDGDAGLTGFVTTRGNFASWNRVGLRCLRAQVVAFATSPLTDVQRTSVTSRRPPRIARFLKKFAI